jgi:hypothetical protein
MAESGNGSIVAGDLENGVMRRISGLKEPQARTYLPDRFNFGQGMDVKV